MRSSGSLSLIITCIAALPGITPSLRADASDDLHLLKPVPIQEVKIEDAFWTPKIDLWKKTTINDVFDKFEKYGGFRNFDRVAAGQTGGHSGEPWWDGLVYETITGASRFLASSPDPEIKARIDGFIDRIGAAAAKDPDGFVNTACTLNGIGIKWSNPPTPGDTYDDRNPHLLYNAGCLVEAGVNLYRATGDTKLLKIAVRMANYMCGIMGAPPKQNIIPGHALGEESFMDLYELFKEHPELKAEMGMPVDENEYRRLAEFWIEYRGNTAGGRHSDGSYNQDDKSVFDQTTMEGHSVRAVLLGAGVAKAASINGREDYAETGKRWWDNMAEAKMYITGGLGAIPSIEGFGPDYELPNTGYAETCAAVAGGFFSHEMNLLTGNAKYVDVLEKELYNGALSGVAQTGTEYFYTNHLSAGPDHRRWDWKGGSLGLTPCCPPMFLKLLGKLPQLIYATSPDNVYVNLFIGSTGKVKTDTLDLEIKQTTEYPWEGTTELTVNPAAPKEFALNLRVPGWAKDPVVEVNGTAVSPLTTERNYIQLKREWKAGDKVVLRLPMPVEKMKADPRVAANIGRVSLMRGPIVYCFEGVDNEGPAKSFLLTGNDTIKPEFKPDLMGGMMVLKGTASLVRKENGETTTTPTRFTAIPFFANANRAPTNMEVWIPDEKAQASPLTFAGLATPTASHCYENDTVFALNDGLEPSKSDDESIPRMTFWDHRGSTEWVQYDFATPKKINSVDVYWWDERRLGRDCRVPRSWTVQYLDGVIWKPVKNTGSYGVEMDKFNHVDFQTVETKAIRIIATLQSGWSGGILEWRVSSPGEAKVSAVPGSTVKDLFVDSFDREGTVDVDDSLTGVRSSLTPALAPGAAWREGYESGGMADASCVANGALRMATEGMSEMGLNHNFVDQSILDAGGFSVSLKIVALTSDMSDAVNRFVGFGVGLNETDASLGNDISGSSPRSIRGEASNPGAADCFVELDIGGRVNVWVHGELRAAIPVGATSGTLTAAFALNSFSTASTVSVDVYFNGIHLTPSQSLAFNWDESNANYLALSARATSRAELDNFAVRKLPIADALVVEYGLGKGLTGDKTSPSADPDLDDVDNSSEWAFGSNPSQTGASASGAMLTPAADGLEFSHNRLKSASDYGLTYRYEVSDDMANWRTVTAASDSAAELPGSPGYETAHFALPESETLGKNLLFLRITPVH